MDSEEENDDLIDLRENTKCEFIPLDLDLEVADAMNEPLPEVEPMDFDDEDEDEFQYNEFERDSSQECTEENADSKMNYFDESLGCAALDSQTPIKSQIIYKSLPNLTSNRIEKKGPTNELNFDIGKLSLHTPVKLSSQLKSAIPKRTISSPHIPSISKGAVPKITISSPSKTNLAGSKRKISPRAFNRSEIDSTPVTHIRISMLPTQSSQKNKGIFRTPIQPASLIKPREPISSSLIPRRHIESSNKFEKLVVNGNSYFILKTLGKGGSSTVFQCFDCMNQENRAIKCVELDTNENFLKEIHCLKKLQRYDRVIKMYDYEHLANQKKLYVVMEMGSGDMSKILKELSLNLKLNEMAPPYLILFYWMEMLRAVYQIHKEGIIHSDLKPANFLLVDGKLKIIDFGISSSVANDSTSIIKTVSEGTGNYISPEALNYEVSSNNSSPNYGKPKFKIGFKSDVWSLGCILYQLVYKRPPFHHITNTCNKLMTIANPKAVINYPQHYKVPNKFVQSIKKCLVFDVAKRASVKELIEEYCFFDV